MNSASQDQRCGWSGSVGQFLDLASNEWLTAVKAFHRECMLEPPSDAQIAAWSDERRVLAEQLTSLIASRPQATTWSIVFEFELPRERGRRPDVVLLAGSDIIVLEFKGHNQVLPAHVDQTAAY